MKKLLLVAWAVIILIPVTAQETENKRAKVFKIWIKQFDQPETIKGILVETGDSSVYVAGSFFSDKNKEYKFDNIDVLKIRHDRSVQRGAIAGSLVGFGTGTLTGILLLNDWSLLTGYMSFLSGFVIAIPGAGIGSLAGLVKDRFPIKGSFENFDKYLGNLQIYSYVVEKNPVIHPFEHRFYILSKMGISFTGSEFAASIPVNDYEGMDKVGISFSSVFGYRFHKNFGVTVSFIDNAYNAYSFDKELFWTMDGIMFSPVVSLPLNNKFRFDLSAGIGQGSTTLADSEDFLLNGKGFGYQLNGTFIFDHSKRWFSSISINHVSSNLKYKEGGTGKARSTFIDIGMAYKFGKKNL